MLSTGAHIRKLGTIMKLTAGFQPKRSRSVMEGFTVRILVLRESWNLRPTKTPASNN